MGNEWIPVVVTLVTAAVGGVGYYVKRKWDDRTNARVELMKEVKYWQDKCYSLMQERIDYEIKRRESAEAMRATQADLAIVLRDLTKQKDTPNGSDKT